MDSFPEAQEVVLASRKPKAPPFHQFIVKKKLLGGTWQVGDQAVIYKIVATTPTGKVKVTEKTVITFQQPTE